MHRVIITGGSGFIGTNLVEFYRAAGWHVVSADVAPPRRHDHGPHWTKLDVLDRQEFVELVRRIDPQLVFHLAARTDLAGRSVDEYRVNTEGVFNAVTAAGAAPSLSGVVFASSMLVCALGYRPSTESDYCPTTAYGRSKMEGEIIVRRQAGELPWTIVRPTSIWGPWFGEPYRNFFAAVERGWYLHPRGAQVRRSYGFVGNSTFILDRLALQASSAARGRTLYVADYEPVELRAWAEQIRAAMNAPRIREAPLFAFRAAARVGDMLKRAGMRNPPLSSFRLDNLLTDAVYDLSPTRELCGELPYSLEQGIEATIRWMRT